MVQSVTGYFDRLHAACQVKSIVLASECHKSGMCTKRASAGIKNDNAAPCLCFLNYLVSLRPATDRTDSVLPWVVSRSGSYIFFWADSAIQLFEEGRSDSGLFVSKRSKTSPKRLLNSIGREEFKHRCPKLANPT
jgi:hypothetical protein